MKLKSTYSFAELPKTGALVNESGILFRAAKALEDKVHDLHLRAATYLEDRFGVKIRRDEDGRVTEDYSFNPAKGRLKVGGDTFGLSSELAEEFILMKWKTEEMQARMNLNRVEVLNQLYSELMVLGVDAKDIETHDFRVDIEEKRVLVTSGAGNELAHILSSLFGRNN